MINRSDCLILLNELKTQGVDASLITKELLKAKEPTLEVLKFINDNKTLDARLFYEKIRKSYNNKKSSLYINIVRGNLEPKEILTCIASLNLQILLYNSKYVENSTMFLRHMRFEEIQKVMLNYALTSDIIPCQKLLTLFKLDLKALEEISKQSVS